VHTKKGNPLRIKSSRPKLRAFGLAIPAAAVALAVAAPNLTAATPPAPIVPPEGAKVEFLRIAPNKMTGRFAVPAEIHQGDYLEMINETNPKQVGPHTVSLVTKGSLPKTPGARKGCFAPKHICLSIAKWHGFNPKTEKISTPLVDVAGTGWNTPGSVSKKGDSWFTEKLDETVIEQITAEPQTLYFLCAVHPWMQGKTKVVPPIAPLGS
jgi:hypothetical protein